MAQVSQPIGIDQCNCFTLRKAARRISRLYDAYLQPTGLRVTQFLLLATLNKLESVAVNALAERLDIERTAMGKMVGPLEHDGLIKSSRHPLTAEAASSNLPERDVICTKGRPLFGVQRNVEFSQLNGAEKVGALRRSLSEMSVDDEAALPVE